MTTTGEKPVPRCCSCRRIRDEAGNWKTGAAAEGSTTDTYCDDCGSSRFPEHWPAVVKMRGSGMSSVDDDGKTRVYSAKMERFLRNKEREEKRAAEKAKIEAEVDGIRKSVRAMFEASPDKKAPTPEGETLESKIRFFQQRAVETTDADTRDDLRHHIEYLMRSARPAQPHWLRRPVSQTLGTALATIAIPVAVFLAGFVVEEWKKIGEARREQSRSELAAEESAKKWGHLVGGRKKALARAVVVSYLDGISTSYLKYSHLGKYCDCVASGPQWQCEEIRPAGEKPGDDDCRKSWWRAAGTAAAMIDSCVVGSPWSGYNDTYNPVPFYPDLDAQYRMKARVTMRGLGACVETLRAEM